MYNALSHCQPCYINDQKNDTFQCLKQHVSVFCDREPHVAMQTVFPQAQKAEVMWFVCLRHCKASLGLQIEVRTEWWFTKKYFFTAKVAVWNQSLLQMLSIDFF